MNNQKNFGRRRLFTGAAGAVATGVVGSVAGGVVLHTKDENAIEAQLAAAHEAGRNEVLAQLRQVKGISVKTATKTAQTTQQATTVLAQPVGRMLVKVAGGAISDALSTLISFVDNAKNLLSWIGGLSDALGQLESLLVGWQNDIDTVTALLDLLLGGGDFAEAVTFFEGLAEILLL